MFYIQSTVDDGHTCAKNFDHRQELEKDIKVSMYKVGAVQWRLMVINNAVYSLALSSSGIFMHNSSCTIK